MIERKLALPLLCLIGGCGQMQPPIFPDPQPAGTEFALRLNDSVRVSGVEVRVVDFQDSRCPKGVQCIHAGTVTAQVSLGSAAASPVTLDQSLPVSGYWLHFIRACPYPVYKVAVPAAQYRFVFAMTEERPASGQRIAPDDAAGCL